MADSHFDWRPVLALAAALGSAIGADAWWEASHPCRYSVLEAASDVFADLTVAGGRFHTRGAPYRTTDFAFHDLQFGLQLAWLKSHPRPPTLDEAHTWGAETREPRDGWGNPIVYEPSATGATLTSYGEDGLPGGACEAEDLVVTLEW